MTQDVITFDQELDARGWNCPLPVLRASQTLTQLEPGQILRVVASDQGSYKNFKSYCNQTQHELIDSSEDDGVYTFYIRKGL